MEEIKRLIPAGSVYSRVGTACDYPGLNGEVSRHAPNCRLRPQIVFIRVRRHRPRPPLQLGSSEGRIKFLRRLFWNAQQPRIVSGVLLKSLVEI